jgi:hypothetical protein
MADQFSKGLTVGVENRGNFVLGLMGGLAAAIIGALIWMGVDVGLNMHLGLVAIVIGAMVGVAIRGLGHGSSPLYGILGAVLTLAGCLGGDILAMLYREVSPQQGFFSVASSANYADMVSFIFSHMSPMSYVIYGIALYEGYKLSIVK